jgi:hypothetical protein
LLGGERSKCGRPQPLYLLDNAVSFYQARATRAMAPKRPAQIQAGPKPWNGHLLRGPQNLPTGKWTGTAPFPQNIFAPEKDFIAPFCLPGGSHCSPHVRSALTGSLAWTTLVKATSEFRRNQPHTQPPRPDQGNDPTRPPTAKPRRGPTPTASSPCTCDRERLPSLKASGQGICFAGNNPLRPKKHKAPLISGQKRDKAGEVSIERSADHLVMDSSWFRRH